IRQSTEYFVTTGGEARSDGTSTCMVQIGMIQRLVKFHVITGEQDFLLVGRSVIQDFQLNLNNRLEVFQNISIESLNVSKSETPIDKANDQSVLRIEGPCLGSNQLQQLKNLLNYFSIVFGKEKGEVGKIATEKCYIRMTNETPITC